MASLGAHDGARSDSLDEVLTPARTGEGSFELAVPEGWQQGRGAFGGLVLGGMVRAMDAQLAEPARRLRSLTAEIVGPVVVGSAQITVEPLRRGNAVSAVRASLAQGGEVLAHAVGVFGAARPGAPGWQRMAAPPMRPFDDVPPLPSSAPFAPVFTRHFEYRSTGPFPFQGAPEPRAAGWVRARAPTLRRDAALVTALADAWWLAGMALADQPRPFATLAFTLDLLGDLEGLDPSVPLFHSAHSPVACDGYASEHRELWGHDGRLVALNHQLVAIIK